MPAVRILAVALAAFVLAVSTEAAAHEIVYEAPPSCESGTSFRARVDERVGKSQRLTVRVEETSRGFVGRLVLDDDEGRVRSFEGRTCGGVLDAVLLAASLEADFAIEAPPEPTPPPHPEESAPPVRIAKENVDEPLAPPRGGDVARNVEFGSGIAHRSPL